MDNGGFPDLSGMIGNLLSNPEVLQGAVQAVAGLKNAGLLNGLSSLLFDAPDENHDPNPQPPLKKEEDASSFRTYGANGEAYTKASAEQSPQLPRAHFDDAPFSFKEEARGQGAPQRSGAGTLSFLPAAKREPDRRRDLLMALRPYLCAERQERLDGILKIFYLLEAARQLGQGFSGGGQEGSR